MAITKKKVSECLETVIDPELAINIVDLGLIYNVGIKGSKVDVDMTLTTPGCPMASLLATNAEQAIRSEFEDADVEVSLVWDPPWTPEMLSTEAKEQLGYNK